MQAAYSAYMSILLHSYHLVLLRSRAPGPPVLLEKRQNTRAGAWGQRGCGLKVHKCHYTSVICSTGKFTSPCTCRDLQSDNTSDIISPVKHLTSIIPLAHASSGLISLLCSPQSASTPPSFSSDDRFTLSCEDVYNIKQTEEQNQYSHTVNTIDLGS